MAEKAGALFGGKRKSLQGQDAPFSEKDMGENEKRPRTLSGTSGLCDRSGEGRTKGKTESVSDRQCDVWADRHAVLSNNVCTKSHETVPVIITWCSLFISILVLVIMLASSRVNKDVGNMVFTDVTGIKNKLAYQDHINRINERKVYIFYRCGDVRS